MSEKKRILLITFWFHKMRLYFLKLGTLKCFRILTINFSLMSSAEVDFFLQPCVRDCSTTMLIFITLKHGNSLHFPARISERSKQSFSLQLPTLCRNAVTSLLVWLSNQFKEAVSEHCFHTAHSQSLCSN